MVCLIEISDMNTGKCYLSTVNEFVDMSAARKWAYEVAENEYYLFNPDVNVIEL